jgi:hypothetical protein
MTRLTVVPPLTESLDDALSDAALEWADSVADLASTIRRGGSREELRTAALAQARIALRLTEALIEILDESP